MALGPVSGMTKGLNSGHHSYFFHSLLGFSLEHVFFRRGVGSGCVPCFDGVPPLYQYLLIVNSR